MSSESYTGTRFELALASTAADHINGDPPRFALGIVDEIGGKEFGHYASIGIVAEGEQYI